MNCIRSQQPTPAVGMTPVPAWHMGECMLAAGLPTRHTAHLTEPQWPHMVNPNRLLLKAE